MTPVYQSTDAVSIGDCLSACLATILDLPLTEVPHFRAQAGPGGDMAGLVATWLHPRGLTYFGVDFFAGNGTWHTLDGVYCVCSVPSLVNPGSTHAVVGRWGNDLDLQIIHDPNPSDNRRGGGTAWLHNVAQFSAVMNHPEYKEPFVNRMVNPEGGMERIKKDPEAARQSAEEHERMFGRWSCYPW